jgi:hypothetical protein
MVIQVAPLTVKELCTTTPTCTKRPKPAQKVGEYRGFMCKAQSRQLTGIVLNLIVTYGNEVGES